LQRKQIDPDCDGVLLDYSTAYAAAWQRAFGEHPTLQDAHAYWPMDRWGVPRLAGEELQRLRVVFDEEFWSTIPPVAGALSACKILVSSGYQLVCVTALDNRFAASRTRNLQDLGFPIYQVITTGNDATVKSPKATALSDLKPVAFVDDYAPYLVGIDGPIHKALVMRDPVGSPNTRSALDHSDSQHTDLLDFARWWIDRSNSLPAYEADDGPLTAKQVAGLRMDVERHFPRGKPVERKDLFDRYRSGDRT
jgi:hypothetical protein